MLEHSSHTVTDLLATLARGEHDQSQTVADARLSVHKKEAAPFLGCHERSSYPSQLFESRLR